MLLLDYILLRLVHRVGGSGRELLLLLLCHGVHHCCLIDDAQLIWDRGGRYLLMLLHLLIVQRAASAHKLAFKDRARVHQSASSALVKGLHQCRGRLLCHIVICHD